MSDVGVAEQQTETLKKMPAPTNRPWLALIIAILLAIPIVVLAHFMSEKLPFGVVIAGAGLSFFGLLAVLGWIAGFVHLGWLPKQRLFFDALFDALMDGCVVTDRRGRVIYANQAYKNLSSKSRSGRVVGIENLYSGFPEISERVYRLAQAAREGLVLGEEFRLAVGSTAAGADASKSNWIRVEVTPIEMPGRKRYTLWRHQDISADRQRQEDAFSHLQYIINYLDHAPAGFFSSTADGKIEYINATLSDWLGLDLSQTTGGNLQLKELIGEKTETLLSRAKPKPNDSLTEVMNIDMNCQNGDILPVRIIHRREFDDAGQAKPSRSLIMKQESGGTLASEPESVLQARVERFTAVAPVGIAKLNRDGTIKTMNAAFAKFSSNAMRGGNLSEIADKMQRQHLESVLAQVLEGKPLSEPVNINFSGDSGGTAEVQFCLDDPDEGAKSDVTAFLVDTSKHSSLEVQLAQSQKMQAVGQLAGGVAHDFNNVLTAIIGFSDLLLNKYGPTDPAFADIMNIKQNANRAANLVRQLLAFSRRQTLRPEVMSLTDAVSDLGNLLGRLLGEKVELDVNHDRDVGLVKIDVNQFEQVVINLAVNARDAMPDGGTVTVRTRNVAVEEAASVMPGVMPDGEYVLCEIADNGSGMPPEVVAKIYEPFFSTKDVGKGTGLGLSTVYGIVKQTGGFIFCDSEIGQGTTFSIYLPRYEKPVETEEDVVKAAVASEPKREDLTGKGTILLVEDEDAVRAFASRALATRGYTVLEASSGEMALDVVEAEGGNIDLVLSDVVMPEMDGPSMLNELRKRGIMTKVVFISGYAEDAFEKNLEGQEDFAFLPKPFSLKQLAEAVKEAMVD